MTRSTNVPSVKVAFCMEGNSGATLGKRSPRRRTFAAAPPTFVPGGQTCGLAKQTLAGQTFARQTFARESNVCGGAGLGFEPANFRPNVCPPRPNVWPKSFHTVCTPPHPTPALTAAPAHWPVPCLSLCFRLSRLCVERLSPTFPSGFKSGTLTTRPSRFLKSSVASLHCPRFAGERLLILGERLAGRRTFGQVGRTFAARPNVCARPGAGVV